jgi:hypothetical protein
MDKRINDAIKENFARFHSMAEEFKEMIEHDQASTFRIYCLGLIVSHVAVMSVTGKLHLPLLLE